MYGTRIWKIFILHLRHPIRHSDWSIEICDDNSEQCPFIRIAATGHMARDGGSRHHIRARLSRNHTAIHCPQGRVQKETAIQGTRHQHIEECWGDSIGNPRQGRWNTIPDIRLHHHLPWRDIWHPWRKARNDETNPRSTGRPPGF